jgi:coproporphyrinogen III oxidase-like Fe-S oxidoreductase
MIDYDYPLFRPPAEADNLILQITYGCSYNRCSFCSMYKDKKYQVVDLEKVYIQIDKLSKYYPDTIKIFLADGDAFGVQTEHLLSILKYLKKSFPKLRRVSSYASAVNILSKSKEQLDSLYENGLTLIYYGIETGDDELLKKIDKGIDSKDIIISLNMAIESKIKISATVILGLGGVEYSEQHIKNSANIINQTKINYLSTLQLGLEEDQKRIFYKSFDNFTHLDDTQILQEQKTFLSLINPKNKIIFRSNHASNALHLEGNLPKDKDRLITQLEQTLAIGERAFVPKLFRGF